MKIGALATKTGLSIQTIRYYEKENILHEPSRNDANYRLYDDKAVRQLVFVKHCRNLGLTLDEIRALIRYKETPDEDCAQVNRIVEAHLLEVDKRLAELTDLRSQLVQLRTSCADNLTAKDCGILRKLSEDRPDKT